MTKDDLELYEKLSKDYEEIVAKGIKIIPAFSQSGTEEEREQNQVIKASYSNPYELNRAIEKFLDERFSGDHVSPLNSEEKSFIKRYTGYGGLGDMGTFSVEESKGLLYEFYTPDAIIQKMWALAYKYGFKSGNSVLEPSVGTGEFLKYAPEESTVIGYEINRYSALIAQQLYPNALIKVMPFEKNFIKNNESIKDKTKDIPKFDLIIGNPPYGNLEGKFFAMGEDKYTKARNMVEYFILRGLDMLNEGGLLIFVVGAEKRNGGTLFLEGKWTEGKKKIAEKSELLDAYRLPASIFERTKVMSEIIVLKKV